MTRPDRSAARGAGELTGRELLAIIWNMQTVMIKVPDEILSAANLDKEEMAHTMLCEYAAELFRQGKLTLMQSASLCSMNIYDFSSLLSQKDIPVIDYDPDDLETELSYFR